jgi:hypothetical protein
MPRNFTHEADRASAKRYLAARRFTGQWSALAQLVDRNQNDGAFTEQQWTLLRNWAEAERAADAAHWEAWKALDVKGEHDAKT